jgi:hypothetical protein
MFVKIHLMMRVTIELYVVCCSDTADVSKQEKEADSVAEGENLVCAWVNQFRVLFLRLQSALTETASETRPCPFTSRIGPLLLYVRNLGLTKIICQQKRAPLVTHAHTQAQSHTQSLCVCACVCMCL